MLGVLAWRRCGLPARPDWRRGLAGQRAGQGCSWPALVSSAASKTSPPASAAAAAAAAGSMSVSAVCRISTCLRIWLWLLRTVVGPAVHAVPGRHKTRPAHKVFIRSLDAAQVLLVACTEGTVHWLEAASGLIQRSVHLGSGIMSCPVLDPWQGLAWVATHAALVALHSSGALPAFCCC